MAIGLGLMLGITYPENFNHPYRSASMREFWRRWHMTLSRWFRDYLYLPSGRQPRGAAAHISSDLLPRLLALLQFLAWASWNFLLQGLWHGAFLAGERTLGIGLPGQPRASPSARALGHAYTRAGRLARLGRIPAARPGRRPALFQLALLDWRTLAALAGDSPGAGARCRPGLRLRTGQRDSAGPLAVPAAGPPPVVGRTGRPDPAGFRPAACPGAKPDRRRQHRARTIRSSTTAS